MENIELVIKISEKLYEDIKKHGLCGYCSDREIVSEAIANGMPLPKGHGRIVDMDEAIKCIKDVEGEDAVWAIGLIEWACGKRTIVEADKEQEE